MWQDTEDKMMLFGEPDSNVIDWLQETILSHDSVSVKCVRDEPLQYSLYHPVVKLFAQV